MGFQIIAPKRPTRTKFVFVLLSTAILIFTINLFGKCILHSLDIASAKDGRREVQENAVYLPIMFNINPSLRPRVNLPYLQDEQGNTLPEQAAVFGFGKVTSIENYADVRTGYDATNFWVRVSIFDRRLWYDPIPTSGDLINWDAVSLYLSLDGISGKSVDSNTYRFDAQLTWWEERDNWQAAYKLLNGSWFNDPIYFRTGTPWWGNQPNDDQDDRAWAVSYVIPLQSLGFDAPPLEGTEWRLSIQLHDRDDSIGTQILDTMWPEGMLPDHPITWGIAHFGLPSYTSPPVINPQSYILKNGYNGVTVIDGMVGGDTICGEGLDFWNEWGNTSYPGSRHLNVQNQKNSDDWPCFSKIYITFPLDSLPVGKDVITATLTLHQLGNSIGFPDDPPKALNSLLQIWEINENWDPATLSWNNAPQPVENLSRGWVGSIYPGDPADLGIARLFDVSLAVARAYSSGKSLQILLYSADYYGPHGKYFFSSNSTDWGGLWRPSLEITLGDPID